MVGPVSKVRERAVGESANRGSLGTSRSRSPRATRPRKIRRGRRGLARAKISRRSCLAPQHKNLKPPARAGLGRDQSQELPGSSTQKPETSLSAVRADYAEQQGAGSVLVRALEAVESDEEAREAFGAFHEPVVEARERRIAGFVPAPGEAGDDPVG